MLMMAWIITSFISTHKIYQDHKKLEEGELSIAGFFMNKVETQALN